MHINYFEVKKCYRCIPAILKENLNNFRGGRNVFPLGEAKKFILFLGDSWIIFRCWLLCYLIYCLNFLKILLVTLKWTCELHESYCNKHLVHWILSLFITLISLKVFQLSAPMENLKFLFKWFHRNVQMSLWWVTCQMMLTFQTVLNTLRLP